MIKRYSELSIMPLNHKGDKLIIDDAELISFMVSPLNKVVSNAFLTKTGLVLKNLALVDFSIPRYKGRKKHFHKYALVSFFFRRKKKVFGKFFIIHNHWCPGYYHWVTEALPRLMTVKEHIKDRKLLIPEDVPNYVVESLKILGISKIESYHSNLIVEDLLVPENVPYTGYYDITGLKKLKAKLRLNSKSNLNRKPYRKVYITRSNAERRKISNETEFIHKLRKLGFDVIKTEDLTFFDQIELFSETKVLVSIHGAGLSNLCFMNNGMDVIELQAEYPGQKSNILFLKLANIFQLNFHLIKCKATNAKETIYSSDVIVDNNRLEELILGLGN